MFNVLHFIAAVIYADAIHTQEVLGREDWPVERILPSYVESMRDHGLCVMRNKERKPYIAVASGFEERVAAENAYFYEVMAEEQGKAARHEAREQAAWDAFADTREYKYGYFSSF